MASDAGPSAVANVAETVRRLRDLGLATEHALWALLPMLRDHYPTDQYAELKRELRGVCVAKAR